jgi:hypothetical protein
MTQGYPAQPNYGPQFQQPQQFVPPAGGYAPPAAPQQYVPPTPQYQQGMGVPAGNFFVQQDPHVQAQQQAPQFQQPSYEQAQYSAPVEDTSGFWGGASAISFDDKKGYVKGTFRGGQIISKTISNQTDLATRQPKKWDDGSARKQMQVLLQTSERADPQDNGQRQLFIKGDMPRATREAFQAAGKQDLEIGGWLYMAWVDDEQPKTPGFNPKKVYKAVYAPAGSPDPMAGQQPYRPASVPAPAPAPVPQPSASADQFAAYAAYQQQMAAHQASVPQGVPSAAPAQQPYDPALAAQQAAAQYGGHYPGQPQQPTAPGSVGNMPAQQSATMNAMWQAAQQMEPQTFGQPGQAPPEQQFAPQGQQPGQVPPGYGQFQPGAQPTAVPNPQQPTAPVPQSGSGAPQGFNPFG